MVTKLVHVVWLAHWLLCCLCAELGALTTCSTTKKQKKSNYFLLDHNQQKDQQQMVKDPLSQRHLDWELGLANVCDLTGKGEALSHQGILTAWEALELTHMSHSCYLLSPPVSHHVSRCRLQTESGDVVQSHL